MEILEKPGSQHMVKGKESNCVYKNVRISLLQNLSSVVDKEKLPLYKLRSLSVQEDGRKKKHFHACWFALVSLDFHSDNEFY